METVQFNVRDAALLYSFPKPLSDLKTMIRCFKFLNRTAAPTHEELTSCLTKAQRAGIVQELDGKYGRVAQTSLGMSGLQSNRRG